MIIGAQFLCEDFPTYLESVKLAEKNGYGRAWVVDSQMLWEDAYVYMSCALNETESIKLGTAVSNPITRHYTVCASAAATLARMHPGRMILGLGRGDSAIRTLGYKQLATAKMEHVLKKVRALTLGEKVQENDAEICLRWAHDEVPIMYAATGPRNLRLGGALADIVMLQVGTHPSAVRWAIEHVHAGAREAGRDPAEVNISLLCGMWVSDDQREALDKTRWSAACAANHLDDVSRRVADHGMPEELTRLIAVRRDHYDYYDGHLDSDAEHTEYLTDELIADYAIAGTAEHCRNAIRELQALGVGEISSAYLNGAYDQIKRVGDEIIKPLAAE
ncbi:MAG: LLM class flavin-dependent oxidoreductase [Rhodospirillaceae bacterium]|jgi:5,10-methylenetetrahydromethanopterin reductase|nr:LLM class flavin-dependent oxidoreductase [Rhodospirillaceae bacterium]MBT6831164.1 LLM class flavin-dependent oxidoreductase [Rhodospirillaceae bacterium]MBT7294517.1 LLM class flavin-dependent oxidoreductase [Rhodospirillaceae bacterium]